MLDIKNYFKKEPFKMVLDDKLYVMDDSADAFMSCLAETKTLEKAIEKGEATEMDTIKLTLKYAFGEKKANELMKLEVDGRKMPLGALMDICKKAMECWQGAMGNTPS